MFVSCQITFHKHNLLGVSLSILEKAYWQVFYSAGSYGAVSQTETEVNRMVQASMGVIQRECTGCASTHGTIFYRRKQGLQSWSAYQDLLVTWSCTGVGTSFDLYSTYDDAINDRNKWTFCNGDDPGVGFPRDAGPTVAVGGQWNSLTKSGQSNYKFSVLTNVAPASNWHEFTHGLAKPILSIALFSMPVFLKLFPLLFILECVIACCCLTLARRIVYCLTIEKSKTTKCLKLVMHKQERGKLEEKMILYIYIFR